jgi:photosystem II stability/assembly factor-like uncharacterized protein
MGRQPLAWLFVVAAALAVGAGCDRRETAKEPAATTLPVPTQPAGATGGEPAAAPVANPTPVQGAPGWEVVHSGVTDDLHAVAFTSDQVGVAVGANRTVIRTEDGGRSWRRVMGPDDSGTGHLASVVFADAQTGWLRNNFTGDVHRTTDGGKTWKQVKTPNEGSVYAPTGFSAHAVAGDTYFWMNFSGAVGGNALYKTAGDGKWEKLWDATPYLGGEGVELAFPDATHGWMSSRSTGTYARYFVGRSTDGGKTWDQWEMKDKVSGNSTLLHAVDKYHGWFSTAANYHVHATDDGGKSWIPYELGNGWASGIRRIQFLDPSVGHVLCIGGDKWQVRQSTDGGKTWRGLGDVKMLVMVGGMFFRSKDLGWVVGNKGYVARYEATAK